MSRSRIFGVASAAAAITFSLLAPSATAAETAGALRSNVTSVSPGATVKFSGKVPTKVRRPIVLQRKTGSGWTSVLKKKTNKRGKIALATVVPSTSGKYTYRVKASKSRDGRKVLKAITTPTTAVTVAAPAPAPTPPPPPAPPAPPAPGSREHPLMIDTPFQSNVWRFRLGAADFDAWPEIAAENMFNDPPALGWNYVTLPVTYTYLGAGTGEPFWDAELEFVGNNGIVYDEGVSNEYCGVVPNQVMDMGEMFAGATATGTECVPVPTTAIAGGHWRVSGELFPTNWVYVRAG